MGADGSGRAMARVVHARDRVRGRGAGRPALWLTLAAVVGASPTGSLRAQGFGIFEHGACAMGRAGAVVADPCDDATAVFFNPAELAGTVGWRFSLGATLFAVGGGFTDDATGVETDLDNDPIFLPHLFGSYGLTDRLAIGLGVWVPYGLKTKWPIDFEGRFVGYDNGLVSYYIHPAVAYRANDWLSVGGGPILVIGRVELNQRLDLSAQELPAGVGVPPGTTFGQLGIPFHTDFADAKLEASGATGFGGQVAVLVRAGNRLSFGARYLTRVTLDYDGDADFTPVATRLAVPANNPLGIPGGTPLDLVLLGVGLFSEGGPLEDQAGRTEITMPDQFVLGVAYQATSLLTLAADWQWVNWSVFDEIVVEFTNESTPDAVRIENYRDTNGFRFGAEYEVGPSWTLRGGYLFHNAAVPDATVTPLLPEASRDEVTAGVSWRGGRLGVHFAYQYIVQEDRRGRVRDEPPDGVPSTALNSGLYDFTGHLFGGTVTLYF